MEPKCPLLYHFNPVQTTLHSPVANPGLEARSFRHATTRSSTNKTILLLCLFHCDTRTIAKLLGYARK
jgi:hypothetical protein